MGPEALDPDVILARLDELLGARPGPAAKLLEPAAPAPELEAPSLPAPEAAAGAPTTAAESPTARAQPSPHNGDRQPRILITEDNKDYRRLVKHLLTQNGYEALEAKDGPEGLREVDKARPDLVLLDYDIPGLNGYELLQELRRREDTRKLPVILMTGSPKRRQLRELGMDLAGFLEKPVPNAALLEAVAQALGDHAPTLRTPPPEAFPGAPPPSQPAEKPLVEADLLDEGGISSDDLLIEERSAEPAEEEEAGLDVLAADSPLVNRINHILVRAVEMGASDIHIEPQEHHVAVRVRVDGILRPLCRLPIALQARVAARIKIMASLVITERRRPQDGQVRATVKDRKVEFRVSTVPSIHGEKVVLRILGTASLKSGIHELGLRPRDLDAARRTLESPHGLLLVTGPTGSGKTTTLYTMLRALNNPEVNIMTAEDPVEYELSGITQVQIRAHIGLTFEGVLRSFLRQDPDIMLVGEIRDLETAEIAVKAAITGHLVLSTLHTNSAPAAVMRLTHMGLAPHLAADSLKLVIAQRLVRRLCAHCKAPSPPSPEAMRLIGEAEAQRLAGALAGAGCSACERTGYRGRMPLFEVMEVRTTELRQLILSGAGLDKLAQQAGQEGMLSLRQAAVEAVAAGETSIEEALNILLSE